MVRRPRVPTAAAPVIAGAVAVVLAASPAVAHVGGPTHGIADGAVHPLTGMDHLLAMVAVGVIAVMCGRRVAVPGAFLLGMAVGGALGVAGVAFPGVELAIVASVIVLGVAVIAAPTTATPWSLALLVVAGLAHGNAHGTEVPSAANPVLYALGFLAVTAALHATGILGGTALRRMSTLRVAVGATVAVTGVLLLG